MKKHIHFIGVAGTAMASLARAFKIAGFKISGSEAEHIFPPMSEYLGKNKIRYYSPFNKEKLHSIVSGKTTGSLGSPSASSGSLGMTNKNIEIVIGNAHYSDSNQEVVYARENKIELEHFPRLIEKYLIKKNSVVAAGTYGKTTTTAMIAWLLDKAGKNPNYMLGGIPINLRHGARLTPSNDVGSSLLTGTQMQNGSNQEIGANSTRITTPPRYRSAPLLIKEGMKYDWSVVEGDEYPAASPWDFSPKFDFYHPKFLLLTSTEWDHMDIFKTKKSYLDVFKKLVARVPKNGLIVAKANGENLREVLKSAKCRVVYYTNKRIRGLEEYRNKETIIYFIDNIKVNGKTTEFVLKKYIINPVILAKARIPSVKHEILNQVQDDKMVQNSNVIIGKFTTRLLGEFNLENWCGAIAMALELGVPIKILQKAVANFKGVKRRLEIRAQKNGITIIDDFAHSPSKAKQSIIALRKHFPREKIYVIFEPNRGGRSVKCLKFYDYVFKGIDKIFIPKLSDYKPKPGVIDVSGKELAKHLRLTHNFSCGHKIPNLVVYEKDNTKILAWLKTHAKQNSVIAFLGSRDFGGMIDITIKKL